MSKSVVNILIAFGLAAIVSFALSTALSIGGDDPGLTPMLVGAAVAMVALVALNNLSGNRAVKDASDEARAAALAFQPPAGQAALYVFRSGFIGKAAGMNIALDEKTIAQLKSPRFTSLPITPGAHKVLASFGGGLASQSKPAEFSFEAAAGEIVALKVTMGFGAMQSPIQIERVSADEAKTALASMRMVAPD
ncbi:MAG: hypothetical protein AB7O04_04705 [Hyphomonadaceae bacterium]